MTYPNAPDPHPPHPASGPPASGPPASGPPASGPPASGPPASGPPASGPPYAARPYPAQPYSTPPYAAQPYSTPPYAVQPYPAAPLVPLSAPFGVDPATGVPLSDKSKVAAGVLQLLPGGFLTLGGIGRLYAGHTALGVVQIVATVVAWTSFWCGFLLIFPFFFTVGAWLWFVVDGIVLLSGRSTDGQGRLMRS